MSCSKGVFRVLKKSLDEFDHKRIAAITSIPYGHDDGMESVLCGTGKPGGWKTRDGELWFPTGKGLVAFDPRILKINRIPPPVYIEDLMADKHSLLTQVSFPLEVRVPPGRGELEFHYTAPSFQRPERIRFRYKLEGIDPEWIEADTRRVAYYNNLSPGRYLFRVVACNSDGVWNDTGASMSILLLPHFWQTWWFRVLAVSAVTAMVAGMARQVTRRRMQRKMELLEQRHAIEKERLRIAQDIHDDLGGSLTQIALLGELAMGTLANPSQAARHLTKITDSARLNVRALDEIVWAVHPGNDTLNSLVLYLWQFAEEFFATTGVRCRVEAPPNIPSHPLSSDLRHSIFLMVKEAFNNTIKHAGASEVRLRFTMISSDFIIAIEDNGKGFHAAGVHGSGNGLSNMKRRIAEIGGKIALSSTPDKGTRIEFVLPLKNHYHVN
jgi:signal transduction histidine kinase